MADEAVSKKRTRSPNFPYIDLGKAVERAKELYEAYKSHEAPITVVHECWGYKKLSGVLQQTVAALRAYGLVEINGSGDKRQIKISEAGRKIVMEHTDGPTLIKEAATKPQVFQALWERYGKEGLPPDSAVRQFLLFDYETRFNEDSVDAAIDRFKESITYAKLTESDIIPPIDEKEEAQPPDPATRGKLFKPVFSGQADPVPPKNDQKKACMIITNVYDLPNAKLSVQLEQIDPELPLGAADVETAEIYWGAFKSVVEARVKSQKREPNPDAMEG